MSITLESVKRDAESRVNRAEKELREEVEMFVKYINDAYARAEEYVGPLTYMVEELMNSKTKVERIAKLHVEFVERRHALRMVEVLEEEIQREKQDGEKGI